METDWSVVPGWLAVVGAITTLASPFLALSGVMIGARLTRKADEELDVWRHREETMRMVRWAVEQILDGDEAGTDAGVVTLRSLMRSELLQAEDYDLVAALTAAVTIDRVGEATYADLEDLETEVVELETEVVEQAREGDSADG
jgi:hypothetical protein